MRRGQTIWGNRPDPVEATPCRQISIIGVLSYFIRTRLLQDRLISASADCRSNGDAKFGKLSRAPSLTWHFFPFEKHYSILYRIFCRFWVAWSFRNQIRRRMERLPSGTTPELHRTITSAEETKQTAQTAAATTWHECVFVFVFCLLFPVPFLVIPQKKSVWK